MTVLAAKFTAVRLRVDFLSFFHGRVTVGKLAQVAVIVGKEETVRGVDFVLSCILSLIIDIVEGHFQPPGRRRKGCGIVGP